MSFGDPNNPYGQPQGQGQQPGYGYPQQAPQGVPPQQGYGYPAAPPVSPYGGGYPQGPVKMPGLMTTARVLLFIIGGLQLIGAVVMGIGIAAASSTIDDSDTATGLAGLGFVLVALLAVIGGLSIFLGVKFSTGGTAIRVITIIYASLMLVGALGNFAGGQPSGVFGGIVSLAIGGIILASMVGGQASAWFNRNKQQY
ncbi:MULTISPECIES: hypothetical protein [unclassified Streptomyces]|uniref:hypothetical protein n=1 Tax=unclassified Streptomyces TaxID=2593676 RepID=UPI0007014B0C|nr:MULTISPECIES: hypothetical protein [unclassified Streptomyces]KQX59070.1 hypothetical protein ASD33_01845 [Streptomyces sp. Root1304]KRB00332.1 hypothetical protein ASE09_01845 [Streptomyces sp. Root66D1]